VEGVAATDCAVVATVQNVKFPIRYLNDQTLVFHHNPDTDSWSCISSLNEKQAPKRCITN
ncbi:hypothetical protein ACS8FD_22055, partial [Psychrobacter sp. 1U2]